MSRKTGTTWLKKALQLTRLQHGEFGVSPMVASPRVRELSAEDRRRLEDIFARFRAEFAAWTYAFPELWELLAFVQYEDIQLPIVEEAEPFIRGQKCIALYGARWRMLAVGDEWHFALDHDDFADPVDLTNFNKKRLERTLSQKWKRLLLNKDECA